VGEEKKIIALAFEGCYSEEQLPADGVNYSGIYLVCAGRPLPLKKYEIRKLLYIGEAGNLREMPRPGRKVYASWENCLRMDERLYFCFAPVSPHDRKRAEAALIYRHRPLCNEQGKDGFAFPGTLIKTSGCNCCLTASFYARQGGIKSSG
jgi:hypothetical protein